MPSDGGKLFHRAHLAHAANRVNDNGLARGRDRDPREHCVVNELDAVLHVEMPVITALHAVRARTGIENDRPTPVLTRLAQGVLQLGRFLIGRL